MVNQKLQYNLVPKYFSAMIHFWVGTLLSVSVGCPCFALLGFTGDYGTPGMAAILEKYGLQANYGSWNK